MIRLYTGTPGAGKTLYVVNELSKLVTQTRRPVFHNIAGLDFDSLGLPHMQLIDVGHEGPHNWQNLPDGSLCVFDEIQEQWRVRRASQPVPEYITALERHRHRGFDFMLISQHPMKLDSEVRRVIDRHLHVNRQFGAKVSVVSKFNAINENPDPGYSYQDADKEFFRFPRRVFDFYKSSEIHTDKKIELPKKLLVAVAALFFLLAIFGVMFHRNFGAGSDFARLPDVDTEKFDFCMPVLQNNPLIVRIDGKLMTIPESIMPALTIRERGKIACYN